MRVKLGMRVDLTQIPVSSIDATLPKGPDLAPGQKSPLVVTVTQPDGKVLRTEGQGGGKVQWKDLALAAAVVKANQKGVVSLARDPRISDGKAGHVTITVPSHPDLRAELDIPFRYDVPFLSNFSGSPGMSGSSGLDGSDGTSGSPGSSDPDHPSPGGDGSSGTDGANGQDGGNGANAPPVQVLVTMHGSPNGASTLTPSAAPSSAAPLSATQPSADHPLLEVSVSFAGQQRFYLVDPQGGSLTVKADGGAAGSGGKGGRGGHGGSGGFGTPNGNSGRDGSDGRNGWDGSRGQGGLITVTYDPQAKPYLSTLRLSSQNGPAPIFRQAPVAPLW
ncbi:MAG TPA: hypothetical protein VOA78_03645 [Candidatus Dormibacteraeota bacterium]|nr:hypothetical protein [Candidatus Dormibacteraeota bacterium]